MRRKVLCLVVCAVCCVCLGAEVSERTKGEQKLPGYEIWRVRETRRWIDEDGVRFTGRSEYDLYVYLDASSNVVSFNAYDATGLLWVAWPPSGARPWNDFNAKKAYVFFAGDVYEYSISPQAGIVGQLRIKTKGWVKATGKFTAARNFGSHDAYWEARVRAVYVDTF